MAKADITRHINARITEAIEAHSGINSQDILDEIRPMILESVPTSELVDLWGISRIDSACNQNGMYSYNKYSFIHHKSAEKEQLIKMYRNAKDKARAFERLYEMFLGDIEEADFTFVIKDGKVTVGGEAERKEAFRKMLEEVVNE